MLPEHFSLGEEFQSFSFHLFYQNHRKVLVATATTTPIVVAKTTNLVLDFLFMVRVPYFEWGLTFSDILTPTLFA